MKTMKTKVLNGSINIGTLTITPDMLNSITEKMLEINAAGHSVRLSPEHDFKLAVLAKKLRYANNLSQKSGISKNSLVHWILENVLKDVEV